MMKLQNYSQKNGNKSSLQQSNDNFSQPTQNQIYSSMKYDENNFKMYQKQKRLIKDYKKDSHKRNIPRLILILLVFFVFVFLCFYAFDYFQQTNNFSIAFGVIVCLIVQFKFIGWWGQQQMNNQKIDQIQIVRMKIKSIFGQFRQKTVDEKNRKKYYRYTNSPNDKLFDQQNVEIFDSIMNNARGKKQYGDQNYILDIRKKWSILEGKLVSIQKIIDKIGKLYQSRTNSYKKVFTVLNKFEELDYSKWQSLFTQNQQYSPKQQSSHPNYDNINNQFLQQIKLSNVRSWKTLTYFLQQRGKYNQNRLKDISDTLLFQFNIYIKQMRTQKQESIKKIQDLYAQCNLKRQKNKDINQNIQNLKTQIDKLQNTIEKLRMKSAQNIQDIFKNEVQLRLRRVQLQNQQVKESNMKDGMQKSGQQLFKYYCQKNKWLQGYGVKIFNKKIINYINLLLDHEQTYYHKLVKHLKQLQIPNQNNIKDEKKKDKQYGKKNNEHLMQVQSTMDIQQMMQVYRDYINIQESFKQYITAVLTIHIQTQQSVRQASQVISSYDYQSLKQYGRGKIEWSDRKFIKVLHALIGKQTKIAQKSLNLAKTQYNYFQIYQKQSKIYQQKINSINDRIIKLQQSNNSSKKGSQDMNRQLILSVANQAKQLKMDLYKKIKQHLNSPLKSLLVEIISVIFPFQTQIHEEMPMLIAKQQDDFQQDPRYSRYAQYSDYYQRQQFEEGWQQGNCQKMVNRLLNMFFKQWSNSQFFHEIVKQEIDISLNRKRPSVVDAIEVLYLKIHQKEIDPVENIVVHDSQPFQCLFDFTLNFKGKIAVHLQTKLKVPKQIPIDIKLLIKEFKCPIRVCFTPFSLGKNFASLLDRPYLSVDYNVKVGSLCITKIPFVSTIIKGYILIKLRKKMIWPKRFTLSFPMAYKSPLLLAIKQRLKFEKQQIKKKKV